MISRLVLLFIFCFTLPVKAEVRPNWRYVDAQLKKHGFKKKFISELKKMYEEKHFLQTLELNVLLYLRKRDDHGGQVSVRAEEKVKTYVRENAAVFARAEKDHGVPASVIASLLWIESRHGINPGRFHVASVYLHLLQAPRPEVIKHLHDSAKKFAPKISPKQKLEIAARTRKKAEWVVAELKALEQVVAKEQARVRNLRGSFAGACGIPQFIPSSYLRWSRSIDKKRSPDLHQPQDAIYSVGFYLKDNGWKRGKEKTYHKALLRYNNSRHYVDAILKLASQVEGKPRTPAATTRKKN